MQDQQRHSRDWPAKKFARVALYAALVNLGLVFLKYGIGLFSGSIALKADAIHSLVDVLASLTVFAGISLSERKTRTFPFGLYKLENLIALITSFAIFYAAYEIITEVFRTPTGQEVTNIPIAVISMICATMAIYFFSKYELKVGKRVGSPSLIADAKHVKTDVLSSSLVVIGLAAGWVGWKIDHYIAVVIVVLIAKLGWDVLVDAIKVLLDATTDFKTLDRVKDILYSFSEVREVRSLLGRQSGRFKFIEATILLRVKSLEAAHQISSAMEEEVYDTFPEIDRLIVHYEPEKKPSKVYAIPLSKNSNKLSEHFGEAFQFLIATVDVAARCIIEEKLLDNPYINIKKRCGIKVADWLAQMGVDVVVSQDEIKGSGPYYLFMATGIEVNLTEFENVEDIKLLICNGVPGRAECAQSRVNRLGAADSPARVT